MNEALDIFVSYAQADLSQVKGLVTALRAEGFNVWWDQDIAINASWRAIIDHHLQKARVVLVAWSPTAILSENVKEEAGWAKDRGKLLQVFVAPCRPPPFFGERQGVDLSNWSG